jgi:hypothetical protein
VTQCQELGCCTLNRIGDVVHMTFWDHGWLSTTYLGIDALWHNHLIHYTSELRKAHVLLSELEDEIICSFSEVGGMYLVKLRYMAMQ